MKIKWLDIYLISIVVILVGFIVTGRSSIALTNSMFILATKLFKYLLIVVPFVGGCLISISLRELLFYIFLFVMAIITWHQSKDTTIFQVVCVAFGLRKIDFRKIVLVFFSGLGLGTVFILIGSFIGKFMSVITVSGAGNSIKTSLGFVLPNTASLVLLDLLLMLAYLARDKSQHQITLFICTLPISYLIYRTGARTSLLLMILLYVLWGCLLNQKVEKFILRHMVGIVMGMVLFMIIFSYVASVNYADSGWMNYLNNLTTNRLALGSKAVNKYGVTFLGQVIPYNTSAPNGWDTSMYFWIDNAYIKLLVNDGIFWIGTFLYGVYIAARKAKAAGNVAFVIPVVLMVVLGYSELSLLYCWFDFVLFAAGASFQKVRNIELS